MRTGSLSREFLFQLLVMHGVGVMVVHACCWIPLCSLHRSSFDMGLYTSISILTAHKSPSTCLCSLGLWYHYPHMVFHLFSELSCFVQPVPSMPMYGCLWFYRLLMVWKFHNPFLCSVWVGAIFGGTWCFNSEMLFLDWFDVVLSNYKIHTRHLIVSKLLYSF